MSAYLQKWKEPVIASKYQLVQLVNVHALQQNRRLEVIHDVCMLLPSCVLMSNFV